MTSWLNDYSLAIGERDRKEKAEKDLYNKCQQQEAQCFDSVDNSVNLDTRLAIRTAAYHPTPTEIENPARKDGSISAYSKFILDAKEQTPSVTNVDFLQQAIQDLGEAQRIRGTMELRLQQLADQTKKLFAQTKANGNRITELTLERTQLAAKLRDRDEELKGKAKLLVDVHDETVSLTLQLNMAEEQTQMLKRENKELVDRWMVRMGEEADAMNKASRFS